MNGLINTSPLRSRSSHEGDDKVWDLVPPERNVLVRLKRISIRNKSWFTMLSWKQRRFIDATIMTVDKIRSLLILRILAPLIRRLLTANGGNIESGALALIGEGAYRMMKNVAEKIIGIAQKWGNKSAYEWLDEGFVKYLIIMNLPRNKNLPLCSFH